MEIKVEDVTKTFITQSGERKEILKNFSLCIPSGETVTILGPNGSGKSTLLHVISHLISVDKGVVFPCFDYCVKNGISFLYQNINEYLFPWMTVYDNVKFSLSKNIYDKAEREKKLHTILSMYLQQVLWNYYPYKLSGGQQQLLALACALSSETKFLLLDEPFAALDLIMLRRAKNILREYIHNNKITSIIVSHRIEDTIELSDKILICDGPPLKIIEQIIIDKNVQRTSNWLTETSNKIRKVIERIFSNNIYLNIEDKIR